MNYRINDCVKVIVIIHTMMSQRVEVIKMKLHN